MKIKTDHLPYSWDDVSFGQALSLIKLQEAKGQVKLDTADVLGYFLNIKPETLRMAKTTNLEEVIGRLAFTNSKPPEIKPRSINGFLIPTDLNFQSICRFEDLKELVIKTIPPEGEEFGSKHMENYPAMVAIYAMPDYENATPQQREQFAKQFYNAQVGEVLAIGNFTVKKFSELSQPGSRRFPKLRTLIHKLRLALKGFSARLAFSLRFFLWKKKHRINAVNS